MMSRSQAFFLGIVSLLLLCSALFFGSRYLSDFFSREKTISPSMSHEDFFLVVRVIDGDTFEIEGGEKVRYIGINTPESVDPRRAAECFGKEASSFNRNLIEGKRVRLERDISDRDRYHRLLRFVYLEDGTFVNELLVREGYAYASPYAPDLSKKKFFSDLEQDARKQGKGLWALGVCGSERQ